MSVNIRAKYIENKEIMKMIITFSAIKLVILFFFTNKNNQIVYHIKECEYTY